MVVNHLSLSWEYIKIALKTAAEYRINTIVQVVSMMLNDALWIFFWWIFFDKVKTLNGWGFNDTLILYSIILVSYGLAAILFGNRRSIAGIINRGELDFYLTLPKNPLYHMLVTRPSWFDLGDLIMGIILAFFAISLSSLPLFIVFVITATMIWVGFGILTGSLAFIWGNAEETSTHVFFGLLAFSERPFNIYHGLSKVLVLTLIPAGFLSGIPAQLIREFNLQWFIYTVLFSVAFLGISILIFNLGLKRYESGNSITVRT